MQMHSKIHKLLLVKQYNGNNTSDFLPILEVEVENKQATISTSKL